eukprot:967458-Prymnesium_polylepis.2
MPTAGAPYGACLHTSIFASFPLAKRMMMLAVSYASAPGSTCGDEVARRDPPPGKRKSQQQRRRRARSCGSAAEWAVRETA